MTTDITELAQREKFEAWLSEKPLHARYVHWCGSLKAYDYTSIQLAWEAYQAGGAELVEALEKAQQQIIAFQQRHEVDPRTHEIIDLKERIAELESRTLNVKFPQAATEGGRGYRKKALWVLREACDEAGIKVEAE
jgi:hypothetical protein